MLNGIKINSKAKIEPTTPPTTFAHTLSTRIQANPPTANNKNIIPIIDYGEDIMTVFEKIYEVVKTIPCGRVATYGQVALLAGNSRWARVVGYALHNNPDPQNIPCHRVVNREGRVASGYAFGGSGIQRELLEKEGIVFEADGHIDLHKFGI